MNLKELKIGYVPYLPDLSQPADRRRFPFFAKTNNIPFEIADVNKTYDIILLTAPSNLSKWLLYKRKHPDTKFIFEMIDSLVLPSDTFSNLFKGVGKFVMHKETIPYLDFKKILIEWLKVSDLVICSSTKMKRIIEQWNKNIIVSLDYMQNEVKTTKTDFHINGKMKIVWEGQSVVLRHLLEFKDVFKQINSFCELHVITDEKYPTYGNLIKNEALDLLSELPITTFFHKWEIYKNYEILSSCDCGIIPLDKKNIMAWHKPANKLISFWFAGLPTIVSDTPAYVELMDSANSKLYCSNTEEWVSKIKEVMNLNAEERKKIAESNLNYILNNYSNESLHKNWFQIFKLMGVE